MKKSLAEQVQELRHFIERHRDEGYLSGIIIYGDKLKNGIAIQTPEKWVQVEKEIEDIVTRIMDIENKFNSLEANFYNHERKVWDKIGELKNRRWWRFWR